LIKTEFFFDYWHEEDRFTKLLINISKIIKLNVEDSLLLPITVGLSIPALLLGCHRSSICLHCPWTGVGLHQRSQSDINQSLN
jgi:hypothetical protein